MNKKYDFNKFFRILLSSPEGHVFLLGCGLVVVFILLLFLSQLWSPIFSKNLTMMSLTRMIAGRVPGLYSGFILGFSFKEILPVHFLVEATWVLIYYPLVYFTLQKVLAYHPLKEKVDKIHVLAQEKHETIKHYGVPGLFLYVWLPLPLTGPLIGCVIGYFMGLKVWMNVSIVIASACLTVTCWSLVVMYAYDVALKNSVEMSYILFAVLIFSVIVLYILQKIWQKENRCLKL